MPFVILIAIMLAGIVNNVLKIVLDYDRSKAMAIRQKELDFVTKEKKKGTIEQLTDPIIKLMGDRLKKGNLKNLQNDLEFVNWHKQFNALTFRAFQVVLLVVSIVGIFMISKNLIMTLLVGGIINATIPFLMKSEIKKREKALLQEFPDLIRIMQGYLSTGFTFPEAFENTIPFVGPGWQKPLREAVVDMKLIGTKDALEKFKEKSRLPEAKEFTSMIILAIEQGGREEDAFEAQADNIHSISLDVMESKIVGRNAMAQGLQPLIMLAIILVFIVPVAVESMKGFGGMMSGGM